MAVIRLKWPYKIQNGKVKRYAEHYQIPHVCLIIPICEYGGDVSCDVCWEDVNGVQQVKERVFFTKENIEPINPMVHYELEEMWALYYGNPTEGSLLQLPNKNADNNNFQ